jgi:hypothetical protein
VPGPNTIGVMEFNDETDDLRGRLHALQVEHRDLDEVIDRLVTTPSQDELLLQRLKKRKLLLKDRIAQLERMLEPDIPA